MVANFCDRTACRIRNRRRRHDNNMTLRKKKTPRASQHYMGWRAEQKSLLLPVAGEFFLLTLPFIERRNRRVHFSGGTLPISRPGFLVPGFVDRSTIGRLISLVISEKREGSIGLPFAGQNVFGWPSYRTRTAARTLVITSFDL